jgi:class 3 adenylate cyclase/tetratricopeptide (TPR) repeat protein
MIRTETATIVFTDLVGSTQLLVRLGHDAYEAVRRSHFDSLRLAASVHQGIEIKSTGDGLVFAFRSAGDAMACMIRMQQGADLAARRFGGEPRMRVGASSGETTRDGNDTFGIAVVEAARLCAVALPGQILVSHLVRGLTRGLGYELGRVGEFALKGLPEPVSGYAVEWIPRGDFDDVIALPSKIASVPSFGLYGRADEQAIIERCWSAAQRGLRQVVLLAGEPGIGKTRLSAEAGRTAHARGATVLLGTCDEDVRHPYRPFVEALRHYLMNAPDEVLLQHVREHHGDLLPIAPSLATRVPNLPNPRSADAETERYLMFEAVIGLLATASRQRPVMLILDDLQWADTPELLLLKHVVRSATPTRLLIIGTYRDSELARTPALRTLLADIRGETGVKRIAMGGLDEDGVAEFVSAAVGHELDEGQLTLARAICRDTDGSPLFVGEILRDLMDSGKALGSGEQGGIPSDIQSFGIPEGIKEAIRRRLSRLSATTNKVLSIASVIGLEFELKVLKQIAEMPEVTILDALDEATSAALVAEAAHQGGCYAFMHMLVRATLYEALSSTRRARMHERVGTALEELTYNGRYIDELARHWLAAATVGDATKALNFTRQAGDRALAGLAFEQAAKYYEQALSVLTQRDRNVELLRCDLLMALGDAQRRAADLNYRDTVAHAVRIARSLGDARRFALSVLGNARPQFPIANQNLIDQSLIALYEEAIAALAHEDEDVLLAKLSYQLAGEMMFTPQRERREELSHQAVTMARRSSDQTVLAQALHIRASAINDPTTLHERLALSAEQGRLADRLESLEIRWAAAFQRMGTILESGDVEGTREMLSRMKQLASELRQPFYNWITDHALAMMSVMAGTPDAEREVAVAFELGTRSGQPDARLLYLGQLTVIRRDQGRSAELTEPLRKFADSFSHMPVWRVVLAGLYCETDQLDEARAQIDKLAACDFKISSDWTWTSAVMNLAQVCCDLGNQDLAALYYPPLQSVADQVGVTGMGLVCLGSLAFPCGQLAACLNRWEEAEQYFDRAVELNIRIGARPYLVRTRRAYAAMLLDRDAPDDRAHAAKLIDEGRVEADRLGMRREIDRLDRLRYRMATPKTALL